MEYLIEFLFRWGHVLFGIAWIGLLYYFNFVQGEYFKEATADAKGDATQKLVPNALWWFRGDNRLNEGIILGSLMGTLMMLNVWGIIWPNQKIVIGLKEGDAAIAGPKALLASRTNTLFSFAMLYFMLANSHFIPAMDATQKILANGVWNLTAGLYAGAAVIVIIELNAVWGKLFSFILTVLLSGISYYY
ncbi:MAG TPA: antitermination protein NusG [Gammaproteobacteria bacterium]|nr:antitermination protein NusG [Gammaproteobacteria bacterium]